jgi:hypothetical protein
MTRTLDLRLGDVVAAAELLEDAAPLTSKRLWDALPVEGTMHNLRYGGNATFVVDQRLADRTLPVENRVTFHVRGTLAFYPEWGELVLPYGPAQVRDPHSVAAWATVFARLTTNADALLAAAERIAHAGALRFAVTRRGS